MRNLEKTSKTPGEFLRDIYLKKKTKNNAYSTRSFARDLGLSQSMLSFVLNGKRPLSVKMAAQIAMILQLSPSETECFLEATLGALPANKDAVNLLIKKDKGFLRLNYDVERFKAIGQWYHIAILDLISVSGFRPTPMYVARRLSISPIEAKDALERLLKLGLIKKTPQGLEKTDAKIYFRTQKSEPAVREFHRQMIGKAMEELNHTKEERFQQREISSLTIAVNMKHLAAAKECIQRFKTEMMELLTRGECTEVYQMNLQLFPLTGKDIEGGKK